MEGADLNPCDRSDEREQSHAGADDLPGELFSVEAGVWGHLQQAYEQISGALNQRLAAAANLSLSEFAILARLGEAPERTLRMATLAEEVQQSRSRLTHAVQRLENRGLVLRFTCDLDRRGVYCELTEVGEGLLSQATGEHLRTLQDIFREKFDENQLGEFTDFLRKMLPDAQTTAKLGGNSVTDGFVN